MWLDLHDATTGDIIRPLTLVESELYRTIVDKLTWAEQTTGIIWGEPFGVEGRVYAQ